MRLWRRWRQWSRCCTRVKYEKRHSRTRCGLPDERVDQEAVWTRWQALLPEERAVFEESSRRCWD